MKTILGTGPIGIAVMETLLESNPKEQIILVNSTGKIERNLPETAGIIAADVTSKIDMTRIALHSEVIFSCTEDPWRESFYLESSSALAYALSQTNAKLVFADNLFSYSNTPLKTRTLAIETFLNLGIDFHERVAFVIASNVIGPGQPYGIFGADFLSKLFSGRPVMFFGRINVVHPFTFMHDFARAIVKVGSAPDAFGEIWHVPSAPAMSLDKWIHLFEVNANRKVMRIVLPKMFVRVAGHF